MMSVLPAAPELFVYLWLLFWLLVIGWAYAMYALSRLSMKRDYSKDRDDRRMMMDRGMQLC